MRFDYFVTQEFIEHRNKIAKKYNSRGRSDHVKLMNCDCEFLEFCLVRDETTGHMPANRPQFDTFHSDLGRCEFKCINESNRVTIGDFTSLQDFDTFIFWRFVKPKEFLLQVGDGPIEMEICHIISRDEGLKACRPSKFDGGGYYIQL